MSPQAENLSRILARIEAARKAALSPPIFTSLLAVSKGQQSEQIRPLLEAGQSAFGENRVQEALAKWPSVKASYPHVALHLIGPLQTNKVRDAVAFFDVIHTLDRVKLADALARESASSGRAPLLFIQVNTGEEPQKAGVSPQAAPALISYARDLGLPLKGLMCIPPADVEPAPHFALLAKIARRHELSWLSMGMSGDFETAIRFGATHVRVGTALFGPRAVA
jgi:pyridoxal phosphate enzyme (YggS family)